jgi:hypothetical protein
MDTEYLLIKLLWNQRNLGADLAVLILYSLAKRHRQTSLVAIGAVISSCRKRWQLSDFNQTYCVFKNSLGFEGNSTVEQATSFQSKSLEITKDDFLIRISQNSLPL